MSFSDKFVNSFSGQVYEQQEEARIFNICDQITMRALSTSLTGRAMSKKKFAARLMALRWSRFIQQKIMYVHYSRLAWDRFQLHNAFVRYKRISLWNPSHNSSAWYRHCVSQRKGILLLSNRAAKMRHFRKSRAELYLVDSEKCKYFCSLTKL